VKKPSSCKTTCLPSRALQLKALHLELELTRTENHRECSILIFNGNTVIF
jgi:hypothetical protein